MIDASLDIPRRLNDPPRMFWWDIDVALLVLLLACSMLANVTLAAFALHLLYWHLPAFMTGLKRTPPSYLRELAG